MSQEIFSRTDAYLAYAMRQTDTYPAPQSRLDKGLIELAEAVRLGGASPDVIRQAVNDYLAANPPAGMTDEEIADSVNDSIANGDIQVGTVLTADQINNINDIPTLAEEISDNKITGAAIVNDELVISLGDGSSINAGDVVSDPYVPVVGTVVSVPSTEPAKVTIVNDADTNESTFNFEIPKGDDGSSPTMTQVTDENVLTHALTYDPLTSNEFYAFNCSGLPNTMRYGYCRVNVSQDPLCRDITFKCPTNGRIYVNTIGADPDDPTVLGSWSGWHVSLLEEDVKEYTEADILEMLNLSEVELDILSNLIDDDNISLSKTFSSSKIFQGLQEMLEEGKRFTLSAVATKIGSSYKIATSISQMIDANYIYLLSTSTGYDMYIVDDGGRAVKIGDTQIDLSDYYDKTQVDDKFVTKADADGKYATITTVDGKVDKTDIVDNLTSIDTDKPLSANQGKVLKDEVDLKANDSEVVKKTDIATTLDNTVTNDQIAGAKVVVDELGLKANDSEVVKKTDIATTLDNTVTNEQVAGAKAVYNTTSKFLKTYTSIEQLGLTSGSETIENIVNSMESRTRLITVIEGGDLSIYPNTSGTLIVEKLNIYRVHFKFCMDGSPKVFVGTYHAVSGFTGWQKVCATTVADVGVKEITWGDTTNYEPLDNKCSYMVKNGVCYVNIDLGVNSPITSGFHIYNTGLPTPAFTYVHSNIAHYSSSNISATPLTIAITGTTLVIYNGSAGVRYLQTFSYPVAE